MHLIDIALKLYLNCTYSTLWHIKCISSVLLSTCHTCRGDSHDVGGLVKSTLTQLVCVPLLLRFIVQGNVFLLKYGTRFETCVSV